MGKPKSLKDKLWGAAVVKMSFRLRGDEGSPAFLALYPGIIKKPQLMKVERWLVATACRHSLRMLGHPLLV